MKVWLDDNRPAPIGWAWVKTVDDCIQCLMDARAHVEALSLDHDLGWCDDCVKAARIDEDGVILNPIVSQCAHVKSGYDMACWLEEYDMFGPPVIVIHSVNPEGASRMKTALEHGGRVVLLRPFGS